MIVYSTIAMGIFGGASIFTSHLRGRWPGVLLGLFLASVAVTFALLWHYASSVAQ